MDGTSKRKYQYNTQSRVVKQKSAHVETISEKLQIGLGRYVHDVQFSQPNDVAESIPKAYDSFTWVYTPNKSNDEVTILDMNNTQLLWKM